MKVDIADGKGQLTEPIFLEKPLREALKKNKKSVALF